MNLMLHRVWDGRYRAHNTIGGGVYTPVEGQLALVSTLATMRVPRPGAVSISNSPPMADNRSVILVNP